MSKEREAFEAWIRKQPYGAESLEDAFAGGYQAATTHYQPLLDAKDAEIALIEKNTDFLADENTTLKALLEQAREGLKKIQYQYRPIITPNDKEPAFVIASETLAAINAATGEK